MASTLAVERAIVLTYLRDPTTVVVSATEINQFLDDAVKLIAKELGLLNQSWTANAFTAAANTTDYALAGGMQYEQILRLQRQKDSWPVFKRSAEYVESLRIGTSPATGVPQYFYPLENAAQVITVRLWPTPDASQVGDKYDMLGSTTPATMPPATAIGLSDAALIAMRKMAAAAALDFMSDDQVARLNLDKAVAQIWKAEAAEILRQERLTLIRLKRTGGREWYLRWIG